jgi:ribosomal protein S18 acetylase RimI-like enzyme
MSEDDLVIVSTPQVADDPQFAASAHRILADLVAAGAALGWVDPPASEEIAGLLADVLSGASAGDAAIRAAYLGRVLVGMGYWRRYQRPTHWPHAELQRIAVAPAAQGRGVGRALIGALVEDARAAGIEVLTLDVRGDNASALHLYRSFGFTEYGRLENFAAFGSRRYDKVLCKLDFRVS